MRSNEKGLRRLFYRYWMYFYYWSKQIELVNGLKETFSFNQEDVWFTKYLPENDGSYLDIGAGHPVRGSNTYLLYRRGWSGKTVDPIYGMHLLHRIYRRRDKQILAVVGNHTGKRVLFEYSPTEYSTISETRNDELLASGAMYFRKYEVESLQASELGCETDPLKPFLLSIDIEGMDFEIVSSLLGFGARPRVICIETSSMENEIRSLLRKHDYRLMYASGLNSIFVHNGYLEKN